MSETSIFSILNTEYPGRWSTRNAFSLDHCDESRQSLFIELTIDGRSVIGTAGVNKDFTLDTTQGLLEKAVKNAYDNMFAPIVYSQKQMNFLNALATKFGITNNDDWNIYIKQWDSNMSMDKINPTNVDKFIEFMEKFEK